MPKIKWGGDLTKDDIETGEDGYKGETPPAGLYRFKLRFAQSTKSKNDNPMLVLLLVLDGTWKKEHKKYDGATLWDRITIIKSTAGRVKAFCDALNVSYDDFLNKTVVDEDSGHITKIGKLKIKDEDLLLYIKTATEKYEDELRMKVARSGMLPYKEDADEDDDADGDSDSDSDDDDDDGEEDPF